MIAEKMKAVGMRWVFGSGGDSFIYEAVRQSEGGWRLSNITDGEAPCYMGQFTNLEEAEDVVLKSVAAAINGEREA